MDFNMNYLVVVIVTILNVILGSIWYSPKLFGQYWAQEHGFELNQLKATPWHFAGALLVSFITVLVFDILILWLDLFTVASGLKLGFLVWLGFIATTHFSGVIWAKKPINAYLIDSGFQLVSMLMMGAILAVWG